MRFVGYPCVNILYCEVNGLFRGLQIFNVFFDMIIHSIRSVQFEPGYEKKSGKKSGWVFRFFIFVC